MKISNKSLKIMSDLSQGIYNNKDVIYLIDEYVYCFNSHLYKYFTGVFYAVLKKYFEMKDKEKIQWINQVYKYVCVEKKASKNEIIKLGKETKKIIEGISDKHEKESLKYLLEEMREVYKTT